MQKCGHTQWPITIILAIWEVKIGRRAVQDQVRQKVSKTATPISINKPGMVA
jgi:hypothetical protein